MGTYQKATDLQNKLRTKVSKEALAPHKAKLAKTVLVVVVLAAAGYGAYRWVTRPTANKQQTDTALLDAAKAGTTDATIAKLQQTYNDAATAEGKAQAAYYLAAHYSVKKDHKNALKYYREADSHYDGKNIDVVLGVANEAAALNNKSVARTYYQKAIDYYKGHSDTTSVVTDIQDKIKQLDE